MRSDSRSSRAAALPPACPRARRRASGRLDPHWSLRLSGSRRRREARQSPPPAVSSAISQSGGFAASRTAGSSHRAIGVECEPGGPLAVRFVGKRKTRPCRAARRGGCDALARRRERGGRLPIRSGRRSAPPSSVCSDAWPSLTDAPRARLFAPLGPTYDRARLLSFGRTRGGARFSSRASGRRCVRSTSPPARRRSRRARRSAGARDRRGRPGRNARRRSRACGRPGSAADRLREGGRSPCRSRRRVRRAHVHVSPALRRRSLRPWELARVVRPGGTVAYSVRRSREVWRPLWELYVESGCPAPAQSRAAGGGNFSAEHSRVYEGIRSAAAQLGVQRGSRRAGRRLSLVAASSSGDPDRMSEARPAFYASRPAAGATM